MRLESFIPPFSVEVLTGVVLVANVIQLRENGAPLEKAVREGSITRLRKVFMTAHIASLGFCEPATAEL